MSVVTVVGSANVDTTLLVDQIPLPGMTVAAFGIAVAPGGKGLNQAIAAQRQGAATTLIVAVGTDSQARIVVGALSGDGLDIAHVQRLGGPTGSATIAVQRGGENAIIVVPGANGHLLDLSEADLELLRHSQVVVCQLEIPLDTVRRAQQSAAESGALFILNPSPVAALPLDFLRSVDLIVVNEHEAAELQTSSLELPCVIETRGSKGAVVRRRGHADIDIPARRADVVDTTGAGDTFVGVLAAEMSRGADVVDAARRAVIAASLAVERRGAVPSIPHRVDVDAAIAQLG